MIIIFDNHDRGGQFFEKNKDRLPSCFIKLSAKNENCKRVLPHHNQHQKQRKIVEKAFGIIMVQDAITPIRAIFSIFLIKDHPDRNYLQEKSIC